MKYDPEKLLFAVDLAGTSGSTGICRELRDRRGNSGPAIGGDDETGM